MAPVKVFGPAKSRNVARVLVCLEEVGAEYEVVDMDLMAREHKSPEHLVRNPFGQTPAFQDGDLLLFESRAISKYVLRKYKTNEVDLLREGNLKEAAMVDVWTEVDAHTYNPAISPVVYECLINPIMLGIPTNQKVVDESLEKLKKVLEVYEVHLSKHKYLAGDFISFADLNHFPYTCSFHGNASRGPLRLVSSCEGMVGELDGEAINQEAQRKLDSTKGMICRGDLVFWDYITDLYGVLLLVSLIGQ